jgi:hypothetical protein
LGKTSKDVIYQVGALRLPSGDFTSSTPQEEHHSSGRVLQ